MNEVSVLGLLLILIVVYFIYRTLVQFTRKISAKATEEIYCIAPVRPLSCNEEWMVHAINLNTLCLVGSLSFKSEVKLTLADFRHVTWLMQARNPVLRVTAFNNCSDGKLWFYEFSDPFSRTIIEFFDDSETSVHEQHERLLKIGLPYLSKNQLLWRIVVITPSTSSKSGSSTAPSSKSGSSKSPSSKSGSSTTPSSKSSSSSPPSTSSKSSSSTSPSSTSSSSTSPSSKSPSSTSPSSKSSSSTSPSSTSSSSTSPSSKSSSSTSPSSTSSQYHVLISHHHCILDGTSNRMYLFLFVEALKDLLEFKENSEKNLSKRNPKKQSKLSFPKGMEELLGTNLNTDFPHPLEHFLEKENFFSKYLSLAQKILPRTIIGIAHTLHDVIVPAGVQIHRICPPSQRSDKVIHLILENGIPEFFRKCKTNKVSVHSGLVGCFTKCYQKVFGFPGGSHLKILSPVNLGHKCSPPTNSKRNLFCKVATVSHSVKIESDCRTELYAHYVQNSLHGSVDLLPREAVRSCWDSAGISFVFSYPIINGPLVLYDKNCGRIPRVLSNVGDLSSEIPEKLGKFTICDISLSQSGIAFGGEIFLFVATFYGKLFCTFSYTEPLTSNTKVQILVQEFQKSISSFGNDDN